MRNATLRVTTLGFLWMGVAGTTFSQSSGDALKTVEWSETGVKGGKPFTGVSPQPPASSSPFQNTPNYNPTPPPPSNRLIHHWNLDQAPGSTTAVDSIGGANVTLTGTAAFTTGAEIGRGALSLPNDGTSKCSGVTTPADMLGQSQLTLSMWYKRACASCVVETGQELEDDGEEIAIQAWLDGNLYVAIGGNGRATEAYAGIAQNDTNWHLATLVFDGTLTEDANRLKLYLDGMQQTLGSFTRPVPASTTTAAQTFYIGATDCDVIDDAGSIDDVRVYNRALSATEVSNLYKATYSGAGAVAGNNTLALTPPMGWNSWNKFACNISDELVRQMADAMVRSGMKDVGYQYVVIDDCWQVTRDQAGNIRPDLHRFPVGIKPLADYVHALGLKFGIYSDAGSKTCQVRPGSLGHEYQDARQYAAWGVDYLKLDWCNATTQDARAAYALMRDSLNASGRPIVLSICEWGKAQPWLWGKEVGGNLWRTTGDITDKWEAKIKVLVGGYVYGVTDILDMEADLYSYAGPGHWNDPDMLEVGNGGMTDTEYRSHFSLWCILAAPLIVSNDLRNMRPEILDILTNKEVIAVDQDPLGSQGRRVWKDGDREVWSKQMRDGSRAVVLLNRGGTGTEIAANWEDLGYPSHLNAAVRDLWQKKDLGASKGQFSGLVPPHGVVMITVSPTSTE